MSKCNHVLGYYDDTSSSHASYGLVQADVEHLQWALQLVMDEGELFKFCPRCGEAMLQPSEEARSQE